MERFPARSEERLTQFALFIKNN
ncbi:hypothetical protein BLAT2472_40174 [Burkholderia latens]